MVWTILFTLALLPALWTTDARILSCALLLPLSIAAFLYRFVLPRRCMAARSVTNRFSVSTRYEILVRTALVPGLVCLYGLHIWTLVSFGRQWFGPLLLWGANLLLFCLPEPLFWFARKCADYQKIKTACKRDGYALSGSLFRFVFSAEGKETLRIARQGEILSVYVMGGPVRPKKYSFRKNGGYQVCSVEPYVARFFREGDYQKDEAADTLVYRATKFLFFGKERSGQLDMTPLPAGDGDKEKVQKILLFSPYPVLACEEESGKALSAGNLLCGYRIYETDLFVRGQLGSMTAEAALPHMERRQPTGVSGVNS